MRPAKICVVTAATTPQGRALCHALAAQEITLILGCEDVAAGQTMGEEIRTQTGNAHSVVLPLQLSSPASIRHFVQTLQARAGQLHLLVNQTTNYRIDGTRLSLAPSQAAWYWGQHYLGHFALTTQLLPLLRASARSRIINLAAAKMLNYPQWIPRGKALSLAHANQLYGPLFYRAQWAKLMFTYLLNCRLAGSGVTANCYLLPASGSRAQAWFAPRRWRAARALQQTARRLVRLACGPEFATLSGKLFTPTLAQISSPAATYDYEAGLRLWHASEQLLRAAEAFGVAAEAAGRKPITDLTSAPVSAAVGESLLWDSASLHDA